MTAARLNPISCALPAAGAVEVAELRVGWRTPLRATGIVIRDGASRGAEPLMEIGELSCKAPLWQMVQAAGVGRDRGEVV